MSVADRVVRSILQWQTDNASLAKTIQANKAVGDSVANEAKRASVAQVQANSAAAVSYADAQRAAKQVGLTVEEFASRMGLVVQKEQQAITTTRELASGYQQLARSADQAAAAQSKAGGGGLSTGFGTLRAAGAAVGNIGGGQGVTQAASLIGLASLGPGAVAIGALGVGLKLLTDRAAEAAKAVAATAAAYAAVREATLTKTREELEIERDNAKALTELRREAAADAIQAFAVAEANTPWLEQILNANSAFEEAEASMNQANDALTAAENNFYALEDVLAETGKTAADLAAAARLLADAQLDAADRALEIDQMTKAQRDERSAQIQREIEILYKRIQAGDLEGEALVETAEKMQDLASELIAVEGASNTWADQLERLELAQQALTDRNSQLIDLIDDEVAARDKLFAIEEKIAETVREREARIAEITADREAQIAELTAEGGERRAEIVADSEAKIAKITRDSYQTLYNLTAERDALGFHLEQQRLAKAVGEEGDARTKALQQQTTAEAKSLAQSAKAADKQIAAQISSGDKALATLYAQKRQEEFLVANSLNAQLAVAQQGANALLAIEQQLWRDRVAAFNNMVSWSNTRTGFGASGYVNTPQPLSLTYPGGPSQQQVFNQQWDRRYVQAINASSGVRGPI